MPAPVRLAAGSTFASDYKVVRALHESDERAVYAAEQLSTGKPVALKVIAPELVPDDEAKKRFVDEVRVGGKINSPYLVDVRGAGIDAQTGYPWVAMELLEGQDLWTALLKGDGKAPFPSWDDVLSQLLRGLAAVHFTGVAHGALVPSAIFLAKAPDDELRLQLLDMGVPAQARSKAAAEADRLPYLAPEQASGDSAAKPTMDVWAVGMIAFRMLTGKHYFKAANAASIDVAALRAEIAQGASEPASARAKAVGFGGQLPRSFDAFFGKCTAREPGGRFADGNAAFEGATDLLSETSALGAEIEDAEEEPEAPAQARRPKPPPLPPMVRAIAENPKPAVAAIVLLVSIALAAGFGLGALRGPKTTAADQARAKATGWAMKGVDEAQKACDGGDATACTGLGQLYLAGTKVTKDEAKAVQLFTRACDKGDMPACGALAAQHLSGEGVQRSPSMASEYYRKACDGGDNLSCADLADMFQNGNGVPKDEAKARDLLDRACKAGYTEVCKH